MARIPAVLVAFAAALAGVFATAEPAQADWLPYRWERATICVENRTTGQWPVREAVDRIVDATRADLVYSRDCDWSAQAVTVVNRLLPPREKDAGWNELTTGATNIACGCPSLTAAEITLNDRWAWMVYKDRLTLAMHELLHLWLAHTDHPESLMNEATKYQFTAPTEYDIYLVNGLFPLRGVEFRPAWRYAMPA